MKTFLKRLKNPIFIAAVASFVYQILVVFKVAPDLSTYQSLVDLMSYAVIGVGIYHTFGIEKETKEGADE